jgi:hypothetical protein
MAMKRKLTEQDITELVLEPDSDTVIVRETLLLKVDSRTDDITNTNCTQWADNTCC